MSFAVYGAGAWGTALAITLCKSQECSFLIPRRVTHGKDMEELRENIIYLPGIKFPSNLRIINDFSQLPKIDALLLAVPSQKLKHLVTDYLPPNLPLIICAKGIDVDYNSLLTDILGSMVSNPLLVLSGPNFAIEIAQNLPSASTLASRDLTLALELSKSMRHSNFRVYASMDPIGVQVSGAVKNVIAIACGIIQGKKLGCNAKAALISRGLREMQRLGLAMGAKPETFLGLAAVGDLTLTCSSLNSRNMSLGIEIGEEKNLGDILQKRHNVTEGVDTSKSVAKLSDTLNIRMPICQMVYQILHEGKHVSTAISDILSIQADFE